MDLVISSGEISNYNILQKYVNQSEYIICADGGMNHLLKIGVLPDIIVGDLDSINNTSKRIIKENNIQVEKYPTMKDMTDNEIALRVVKNRSPKRVAFFGVLGSRWDHSIANILLLKKLEESNITAYIVNRNNRIRYGVENVEIEIYKTNYKYLSIIPISDSGVNVSLLNFAYPLDKHQIDFTSTLGISNEIIGNKGKIKIHSGEAIIIESND